jgi:hypothetical protein
MEDFKHIKEQNFNLIKTTDEKISLLMRNSCGKYSQCEVIRLLTGCLICHLFYIS